MIRIAIWFALAAISGCAHALVAEPAGESVPPLTAAQLIEVASAAERLGDRLRAQQYLIAARRAGAEPGRVTARLLRLYAADGQYRLAIDCVREQLGSRPHQTGLRLVLARLYEATELDAAAIAEYERVLSDRPTEARAHLALALLLKRSKRDSGGADHHFRAYLALRPDAPDAADVRASLMKEMP